MTRRGAKREGTKARRLELGCGLAPHAGYVHHDKWPHSDHVDEAWDLNLRPWPWPDGAFEEVLAYDVVEHLCIRVQVWLGECWRILQPGGRLRLRVPHYRHENAWTDPKHTTWFTERTFDYWDPRRELYQKYGCYDHARDGRLWRVETARHDHEEGNLYFELVKEGA